MPDGLCTARPAADADADAANLLADDTLVLLANGSVRQGYRVGAGLTAHPLSPAETARLAQCEPCVPATPLPPDINRRVQAALTAFGHRRLEKATCTPETRERIKANARYIERELGQLHLSQRAVGDLLHTERLRDAFTSELPTGVNHRIGQLRREGVRGTALRDALAELEARLAPAATPPTAAASSVPATGGIRITCSMSAT